MLITGIVIMVLAIIIGGWQFMCDSLLPSEQPRLSRNNLSLLIAMILAIVGIVLLFIFKWYAGLFGIAGIIIGFNVFAFIWLRIYRFFRL